MEFADLPLKAFPASADRWIVRNGLGFQIIDFSEVKFRLRIAGARIWLTYLMSTVFASYAVGTLEGDQRLAMVALAAGYLAWGMLVRLLPLEKIVHSRYRDVFFLAWSVAEIGVIAGAMALDGGSGSPLIALLFIPLVVVALTYPPMLVLAVGVVELLATFMIAVNVGSRNDLSLSLFTISLGITALVCAWQTRIRDAQRDELNRISRADPLTGCLNRRGFLERLTAEVDEAGRTGRSLALVALDLDRFKAVNDNEGHAAGDDLLRWTVEQLDENLRPMDSVGRLGGDEFALLIPGATRPEALSGRRADATTLSPNAPRARSASRATQRTAPTSRSSSATRTPTCTPQRTVAAWRPRPAAASSAGRPRSHRRSIRESPCRTSIPEPWPRYAAAMAERPRLERHRPGASPDGGDAARRRQGRHPRLASCASPARSPRTSSTRCVSQPITGAELVGARRGPRRDRSVDLPRARAR